MIGILLRGKIKIVRSINYFKFKFKITNIVYKSEIKIYFENSYFDFKPGLL